MGDEARSPRHRYSKCDKEYETVEEENCEGLTIISDFKFQILYQFSYSKNHKTMPLNRPVIPAEAGIQVLPLQALDSRFHGNDTEESLFKELKYYQIFNLRFAICH